MDVVVMRILMDRRGVPSAACFLSRHSDQKKSKLKVLKVPAGEDGKKGVCPNGGIES